MEAAGSAAVGAATGGSGGAAMGAKSGGGAGGGIDTNGKGQAYDPYQYNRDNLLGSPFNTNGLNISAAHFFDRWFAIEAQLGAGLSGNTGKTSAPPNLTAKSIFAGAGPRVAYRTHSRYEPWVHLLVGIDHYRFSQTAGSLGSNSSVAGLGGGGMDVYLNPHMAIRGGADVIVSEFFSNNQRSFQVVGGVVLGF